MGLVTTPLGFKKPDADELAKNGASVIADNGQKSEELHADARTRLTTLEGKPVGGEAPPTTAVTTGIYSRRTNAYNVKESQYRRGRAMAGKVKAQTGILRVGHLGDSTVAAAPNATGWKDSPLNAYRNFLSADGFAFRGTGMVPCFNNYGASEPRITLYGGMVSYGAFSNMLTNNSTLNGVQFDTASTGETGTVIEVWYADNSAPFDVNIDGGTKVRVTPTGTNAIKVYTVTGLSNATHQAIAWRVSGTMSILGFQLRNANTYGVETYKAGISGAKTDSLASTAWSDVVQTMSHKTNGWAADLVFITCSTNDAGVGTSAATFKANLQTAINTLKTNGTEIVLTTGNVHQTTDFTVYTKALYELADSNDLTLIDTQARWGTWASANGLGQMTDASHPSPAGYWDLGRALYNATPL